MSTECYHLSNLFPTAKLYRDFLAMADAPESSPLREWYGAEPLGCAWMERLWDLPTQGVEHCERLADALERQSLTFGAGPETLNNIEKLRRGARAIVTGQQVGLFGGPLFTLLKAATAIARAKQVSSASGVEHVPVFWLATEDHDLEEINQVSLLTGNSVETLKVSVAHVGASGPVGDLALGEDIHTLLDRASELLGYTPVANLLRECYGVPETGPAVTFATGFGCWMTRLFAAHGLIVMDAAGREFHGLGASTLRYAVEHAAELESALLARNEELERAGYHAQVLVRSGASLLFLVSEDGLNGAKTRQVLRRMPDGTWKVGAGSSAQPLTTAQLLDIVAEAPERISPNALLRPVFQDTLLPTTAYVGGPAEIAYFAQSAVLYRKILGRVTPAIPRLSATLLEPGVKKVMEQHEVSVPDALTSADNLARRLGARAMPIESKRRLADAGNALDQALNAAQSYLSSLDAALGRSAEVSASKMRYQMERLRRLTADFELQREGSLRKHAAFITGHLFPEGHPQERLLAGLWFLAAWDDTYGILPDQVPGSGLVDRLVSEAANQCPGHLVISL